MLLDQIQKENDIKNINPRDYQALAAEIREFLVNKISVTGGHLGSNLGAVELTMALHLALNLPGMWDISPTPTSCSPEGGRVLKPCASTAA